MYNFPLLVNEDINGMLVYTIYSLVNVYISMERPTIFHG